jgi:two-component system, sensor histidine kinase and response regulator
MTEKPILFVDSSSAATTPGLLPGYTSRVMPNIYDHAASLRRMGNDNDLFGEMADLLKTDAPALLQVLKSAHQSGDAPGMQRAAHTLKGLAANFSAERAVAAAAEAERLAKAQQCAGMPAAIISLEESLDELIAALAPTLEASRSH